ncbi:MAG: hypothetical protein M0C28_21010 [Candidatus Moduliflexus flocculans]|nr:hypothetical protein [Candidatus Moduliflexus flocculans]
MGALYNGQIHQGPVHLVIFSGLITHPGRAAAGGRSSASLLAGFYRLSDLRQHPVGQGHQRSGRRPDRRPIGRDPRSRPRSALGLDLLGRPPHRPRRSMLILANFEIIALRRPVRLLAGRGHRHRAQARGRVRGQVQERKVTEVQHG